MRDSVRVLSRSLSLSLSLYIYVCDLFLCVVQIPAVFRYSKCIQSIGDKLACQNVRSNLVQEHLIGRISNTSGWRKHPNVLYISQLVFIYIVDSMASYRLLCQWFTLLISLINSIGWISITLIKPSNSKSSHNHSTTAVFHLARKGFIFSLVFSWVHYDFKCEYLFACL